MSPVRSVFGRNAISPFTNPHVSAETHLVQEGWRPAVNSGRERAMERIANGGVGAAGSRCGTRS
ncbi:MAG: hypothetical protein KatS3mg077_0617 [Candidatus Binatia bacterium]|nr:MAG: hypothetical protein KatS3mg077_0617 [Candidatus Binatia bacterium]